MTTSVESVIQSPELEVSTAQPPAPGAEDKKPIPATPEETVEAQQETPEQQEAKKQSKFQRRLERQKTARIQAETRAQIAEERAAKLEEQLQAKPSQESAEPKREDFADYETYLRAVTKYDAKQEREAAAKLEREAKQGNEKKQQAKEGSEKVAKAWAERETSYQAATKDYEAAVTPFLDDELKKLSGEARAAIVESEVGPALLHQLAKLSDADPDEYERICELSPTRQIVELGKIEAKVSMPAKKTTSAPAPASTTSGGRTASKDLSKMSQEEYEAHRKSNGARWAR